eukprot:TRINITY_DN40510_c0_g1_i1.p1 TRINITY_DN40510_c0_g1~~TRINITY_DN40510_c0_g1_i1.p1  ORF type:complete len:536 (-),score=144.14 TRINITY_DN40510_c0_g1_i1:230-1837(-)
MIGNVFSPLAAMAMSGNATDAAAAQAQAAAAQAQAQAVAMAGADPTAAMFQQSMEIITPEYINSLGIGDANAVAALQSIAAMQAQQLEEHQRLLQEHQQQQQAQLMELMKLQGKSADKDSLMAMLIAAGGDPSALTPLSSAGSSSGGRKGKSKSEKGAGKAAMKILSGETLYYGKIREYDSEKKRGYIWCPEAYRECGSEVYAFHQVLEDAGASVGDDVVFFIHWNKYGNPQASSPMLRLACGTEGIFALKGMFRKNENGDAYIECSTVKEYFTREIRVPPELAIHMISGVCVACNIGLDGEKFPVCLSLYPCEATYEPPIIPLVNAEVSIEERDWEKGKGKGKGKQKITIALQALGLDAQMANGGVDLDNVLGLLKGLVKGKGKGQGLQGLGMGKGKDLGDAGYPQMDKPARLGGTLKAFDWSKNCGIIESADYLLQGGSGEILCTGQAVAKIQVGSPVTFSLGQDAQGEPQAVEILSGSLLPPLKKVRLELKPPGAGAPPLAPPALMAPPPAAAQLSAFPGVANPEDWPELAA